MARKARQRISYGKDSLLGAFGFDANLTIRTLTAHRVVLPLPNSTGGHRLGVNGLAVDSGSSVLYEVADFDVAGPH